MHEDRAWSIIPGGESEPSGRTPIPSPNCISVDLPTHIPSFSGQAGWGARGHIFQLPADLVPSKFSSVAQSCPTLCNPMDCSTPGLPVHHQLPWSLLRLMPIESVMPPNHLILCHSLLLPLSIFPSIRLISNESALHIRLPKYWSFSFSLSPSNEYSVLIPLGLTGLISLQSKGFSRVFSNTTVQKHKFFCAQLSLWSSSHIHT